MARPIRTDTSPRVATVRARRARVLSFVFLLFQRGEIRRSIESLLEDRDDDGALRRIRCPACSWRPAATSLWYCADCTRPENFLGGCGTAWNTFETAGLCPGCAHQWQWTLCLACGQWAPHSSWYSDEPVRNDSR